MAYEFELDEWRSAVRSMTEVERQAACGHTSRSREGFCYDCGDEGDRA